MSGQSPGLRGGEGPSSSSPGFSTNSNADDGYDDEDVRHVGVDNTLLADDPLSESFTEAP